MKTVAKTHELMIIQNDDNEAQRQDKRRDGPPPFAFGQGDYAGPDADGCRQRPTGKSDQIADQIVLPYKPPEPEDGQNGGPIKNAIVFATSHVPAVLGEQANTFEQIVNFVKNPHVPRITVLRQISNSIFAADTARFVKLVT